MGVGSLGDSMSYQVVGNILQVLDDSGSLKIDFREDQVLSFDSSGLITDISPLTESSVSDAAIDHRGSYILPAFIDSHVHYPQLDMLGVYSGELLEWLEDHTFPHEKRLIENLDLAETAAENFTRELYANGVGTAVAFASSKKECTDFLFKQFAETGGRLISGKVSMDRHAPDELLDPVDEDEQANEDLIKLWHGYDDRIYYALSPRFAPSCSDDLMRRLAVIKSRHKDLYVQTHYSENTEELEWVKDLYPKAHDYLNVYESFDLLDSRTILAHGIHASPSEMKRIAEASVCMSHCPTSNLYLGSGLFPFQEYLDTGAPLSLGTDVGAGTSFSMWATMVEAIKISKLRKSQILPEQAFYAASGGAAKALGLEGLGELKKGFQADFQVIDPSSKELFSRRLEYCEDERQLLSAFIFHSDDRALKGLWVKGKKIG